MGHEGRVLLADCPGHNDQVRGLPPAVAPTAQSCHEARSCFSGHTVSRVDGGLGKWQRLGACASILPSSLLGSLGQATYPPCLASFLVNEAHVGW